jgi:hypothetical protein
MQLGPSRVLLALNIKFRCGMNIQQVEESIDRIEDQIQRLDPTIDANISPFKTNTAGLVEVSPSHRFLRRNNMPAKICRRFFHLATDCWAVSVFPTCLNAGLRILKSESSWKLLHAALKERRYASSKEEEQPMGI